MLLDDLVAGGSTPKNNIVAHTATLIHVLVVPLHLKIAGHQVLKSVVKGKKDLFASVYHVGLWLQCNSDENTR